MRRVAGKLQIVQGYVLRCDRNLQQIKNVNDTFSSVLLRKQVTRNVVLLMENVLTIDVTAGISMSNSLTQFLFSRDD